MMKNYFKLLLVAFMLLSFSACDDTSTDTDSNAGTPTVTFNLNDYFVGQTLYSIDDGHPESMTFSSSLTLTGIDVNGAYDDGETYSITNNVLTIEGDAFEDTQKITLTYLGTANGGGQKFTVTVQTNTDTMIIYASARDRDAALALITSPGGGSTYVPKEYVLSNNGDTVTYQYSTYTKAHIKAAEVNTTVTKIADSSEISNTFYSYQIVSDYPTATYYAGKQTLDPAFNQYRTALGAYETIETVNLFETTPNPNKFELEIIFPNQILTAGDITSDWILFTDGDVVLHRYSDFLVNISLAELRGDTLHIEGSVTDIEMLDSNSQASYKISATFSIDSTLRSEVVK